jgi:dTDP-4-dehydrorhamnose 3,5-epimerase-like enzyme
MNPEIICGKIHEDERGKVIYFNEFDMSFIKRTYNIINNNTCLIRAWQAHQFEQKWFYCIKGEFVLNFIKITDCKHPSFNEVIETITLKKNVPQILYLPGGYATGIRANKTDSILTVYSSFSVEESKKDDYRYAFDKWKFNTLK